MVAVGDAVQDVVVDTGEHSEVVQEAGRTGAPGEEHVGGRLVALLGQQEGQVVGRPVPHVEGDPGVSGERFEDRTDELLAATGVDGQ